MADRVVDRRMLLRGAGVAGASAIGATAWASTARAADRNRNGDNDVTGSWVIVHRDDPPAPPERATAVIAFAEGGVLITQDIAPLAAAGLGAWSREHDKVKVDFWTGAPGEKGSPAVAIEVKARGTVDHDKMSGTYTFTVHAAKNLKKVLQRGTGKFEGHRLEA
ncbi:MAG TPA: hypothetical protein VK204_13005 [Nocardioidaceae bacterium]|nr:hypothetical protein [Nocardioidaceae bacterium]